MGNMDEILNQLVAKLLADGSAEFSHDGLNIKSSYDNGCLKISASFAGPVKDETNELLSNFEEYVKSLSDDFFLEVVETFPNGKLKEIQDKLDSKDPNAIRMGIAEFMNQLKAVASEKVQAIDNDIAATEKELADLNEVRDSYVHVLNKKF